MSAIPQGDIGSFAPTGHPMTSAKPAVPRIVPYAACYEAQVIALARELHAESAFHRQFPLNEVKLKGQLNGAEGNPSIFFRLCVRGDVVLGGFIGTMSTVFFSDEPVAKDITWFVSKAHRGSLAAVMLVAAFEEWAQGRGARYFIMGQATGVNLETTERLYRHLGYVTVGVNTMKRAT